MVEDIFALTVSFEVRGRRGDEVRRLVLDQDRRRSPSGPRPHAVRMFERREECVTEEWVRPGKPAPRTRIETGYPGRERGDEFAFLVGHILEVGSEDWMN